jgi:hypothetical protein
MIADKLALTNRMIMEPKELFLRKLSVYVPSSHSQQLLDALFLAGAGDIGNYSECSFITEGVGSFKPGADANPQSGQIGVREVATEQKIEVVFPKWKQYHILKAMRENHPYEEVAHEILLLQNSYQEIGAGLIGELQHPMEESQFFNHVSSIFGLSVVKHTRFLGKKIKKVAVCGGSGSFLTSKAIQHQVDVFLTSDIKYHEFFDANDKILLMDIGHFESEQYTIELFHKVLQQNFPNFALLKSKVNTNPVHYFIP